MQHRVLSVIGDARDIGEADRTLTELFAVYNVTEVLVESKYSTIAAYCALLNYKVSKSTPEAMIDTSDIVLLFHTLEYAQQALNKGAIVHIKRAT